MRLDYHILLKSFS